MTLKINISVDKVFRKFARINKNVPRSFKNVIEKAAFLVEAEAVRRCPVDTGTLRASINVVKVSDSKYIIQDGVFYGVFQELGTVRTPAQPFMRPAAFAASKTIKTLIRKSLGKALK